MTTSLRRNVIVIVSTGLLMGATLLPASARPGDGYERPAPIVEAIPRPPHHGWHWVAGYWRWQFHHWVWVGGHYVSFLIAPPPPEPVEVTGIAPSPRHHWIHGHYVLEGHAWRWHRGTWVR